MIHRPSIRLVALLLALFVSPLHLAVVQVVGWSYMFAAARVAGDSTESAVAQTFDGSAPCAMCDLVETLAPTQQDPKSTSSLSATQLVLPIPLAHLDDVPSVPSRSQPRLLPWQSDDAWFASADRATPWRPPS